jgi:protein-S-isoprenylcysteine O-methyltransferase Ste14
MRRRLAAILGSAAFFALAPGVVAGAVPYWISRWQVGPDLPGQPASGALGAVLIAAGLVPLVESFARFALQGLGTPAPVFATRHLVVTGFYRHVRNPMYVGVLAVIVGQALLFGNLWLLAYAAPVWLAFHLFVIGYEEPTLLRTFGAEFAAYRDHVPRWVPRLAPWRAGM